MKQMLVGFFVLTLLMGPGAARAEEFVGSCKMGWASYPVHHYNFVLTEAEGVQFLEIREVFDTDGRGIGIANVKLSAKTILENSPERLRVKDKREKLQIDLVTGEGIYKNRRWVWICHPGDSEWCMVKTPRLEFTNIRFKGCDIRLP